VKRATGNLSRKRPSAKPVRRDGKQGASGGMPRTETEAEKRRTRELDALRRRRHYMKTFGNTTVQKNYVEMIADVKRQIERYTQQEKEATSDVVKKISQKRIAEYSALQEKIETDTITEEDVATYWD
jgi:hypothetical protein